MKWKDRMGQMQGLWRMGVCAVAGVFLWSAASAQSGSQTIKQNVPKAPSSDRAPLPAQTAPPDKPMASSEDDGQRFTLSGISVMGSTVFGDADFQPLYMDMVGQDVTVGQMKGVATAIRGLYRNAGYLFTHVVLTNGQTFAGGVAEIQVVEAVIGKVMIEEPAGPIGPVKRLMQRMGSRVEGLKNPRLVDLERMLLLMNDLPGITRATAVPRAGSELGNVDLFVNVERDKISGAVFADNHQSPVIGEGNAGIQLGVNSYTSGADSTKVTYLNSFWSEVDDLKERHLGEISHQRNLGSSGLVAKGRLLYGQTEPRDVLEALVIEGEQLEAEIQLEYPIKRTRRLSLWVNGGFEYRNSETELLGGESVLSDDRLRVLKVGARFLQRDRLGYTEGSIEVRQGLNILDASDNKRVPTSRFDGEVDFTTVRLEIARDIQITRRVSVFGSAAGQLSRGPLLSSEEFAIGGTTFGRGYDPSERTGDHGVGVSGELRFSGDFKLFKRPAGYQLYGFADYGHIWNADRGLPEQDSVISAGGGLRLNLPKDIFLEGEVAVPFTDLRRTNDSDPRFLFNIVKRF